MTDAAQLYEDGVAAVRAGQMAEGRRLLAESLKLDADNDMGWLWYSRTLKDPDKQLQCVERALRINPANGRAQTIRRQLLQRQNGGAPVPAAAPAPSLKPPSPAQMRQIQALLARAQSLSDRDDHEGAVAAWAEALRIQPDQEDAMRGAVRALVTLGHPADAQELVQRALDAGTTHPSIYLTAMDFAARANDIGRLEDLRARAIRLPEADDGVIVRLAEQYRKEGRYAQAHTALMEALKRRPDSQKLLMSMAETCEELGRPREAMVYYNRAVKAGFNTLEGREADKRLSYFTPVLTDRERGSILLALREAFGFGLFFLLLVWQDAGLDLAKATSQNWIGLALGVLGGYLLVTATSSPRQRLLARLFGGLPPEDMHPTIVPREGKGGALEETSTLPIIPEVVRWGLGILGTALLIVAVWLTFEQAITLLLDPVRPDMSLLFGQ